MKLREIFRYELEHRLRRPSTWLHGAFLLGLALLLSFGASPSNTAVYRNAPWLVAFSMLMIGMPALAVSAALFGDAAVRDARAGMDPLLYTTPLRTTDYLLGRYLAALALNSFLLLAVPLGLALPVLLGYTEPGFTSGPFRAGTYAQPYVLVLLPNTIFAGAILFTTGVFARRTIPVYIAAILLFVGTMLGLGPDADDAVHPMLSVLGPAGFHALNEHRMYWTVAEQNTRLIGFPILLVLNRVLWLVVAAIILAVLHRRFRFAHPDDGGRGRRRRRANVRTERSVLAPVSVPRVAGEFGSGTAVRQTLAVARNAFGELVAMRSFVVVVLACVGLTLLWGWNVGDTVFESSIRPATFLVAGTVLGTRVVPLIHVLIILYAGELVWQDRDSRVAGIADAAPVPDGVALLGRFLALVALLVPFQAATVLGGILIQALQGHTLFEIGLYVRIAFGLNMADCVLFATLAFAIHIAVNHRYTGHVVVLIAVILIRIAPRLGIRHNLLVYGGDPGWTYSDMNGFGPYIGPFVWFKLYWAGWALLLVTAATALWVRGHETGDVRRRFRNARRRFTTPIVRIAGAAIAMIVVLGGFILYNTNVLNDYRSPEEEGATQAEYEKRYGRYADMAQPTIVTAALHVEIQPDEPAVDLRGTYRLVNRTDTAIEAVHITLDPRIVARSISLEPFARSVFVDRELGFAVHALGTPLAPGDSLVLSFDVAYRPRGFPNSGLQTDVVGNGAYLDRRWLPFVGYQPVRELTDEAARARFGLPPRPAALRPGDATGSRRHRYAVRNEDRVLVETVIGTAGDQVAVAPGVLRRTWTERGRRYFHYAMEAPQAFSATVFSGRYAVHEDRWRDVALSIFHHPTHRYNLDAFVRGMKASLEYYTEQFGAYQGSVLRIVEIPRYGRFGRAHPHTIAFTEDNLLTRATADGFDQAFFGTAHEVAHQWWGGRVRGASGYLGQAFLSESLANYSAMMVTEHTFGTDVVRRIYDYQMDRYLGMRSRRGGDVPLIETADQSWIHYGKGAVAMYLLRERIGADAVNSALRRYLARYADHPPYPTSLDLVAELRAVTPDSLQYLVTDLFETVTVWDVATERAVVERTDGGEYVVTLDVTARKVRADSIGNETEVQMDDHVEIGVFPRGAAGGPGEPLLLELHRIRSGRQTIRITVPELPARAGIDPYRRLIDRRRGDNVVSVDVAGANP